VSDLLRDPLDLLRRLGETHRPVVKDDEFAIVPGFYVWQCPACDGNRWKPWSKGDAEPGCDLWREYHAYWRLP
jgi:hypothetical protein